MRCTRAAISPAPVDEYERTAYTYAPTPDAAKAAYAALSAYEKREPQLIETQRPAWHVRGIESGVRFASVFPDHPDSAGVLTRSTEELYREHNLPRAIEVAGLLLARNPPATPAQRRIAYSVTGSRSSTRASSPQRKVRGRRHARSPPVTRNSRRH